MGLPRSGFPRRSQRIARALLRLIGALLGGLRVDGLDRVRGILDWILRPRSIERSRTINKAATPFASAIDCPASAPTASSAVAQPREIRAEGPEGDLVGTLLPTAPDKPVVLIIPGSGPTDRDGNNPLGVSAASYRLLAETLAARGIGSIRIGKRGMGCAGGLGGEVSSFRAERHLGLGPGQELFFQHRKDRLHRPVGIDTAQRLPGLLFGR